MKFSKIKKIAAFSLVGTIAAGAIFAIGSQAPVDAVEISGSWANFTDISWADGSDARYKDYAAAAGSTLNTPYLIRTAEEFSGLRNFEDGDELGGKYILIANDIDLSAHYWDPIELYGKGDPISEVHSNWDTLVRLEDDRAVHIDGNSRVITGLNIENAYDKVLTTDLNGSSEYGGGSGLFSYMFYTNLTNLRIESPIVNMSKTSGVPVYESDEYYGEIPVNDIVGVLAGSVQKSHIAGIHISDQQLNYTAEFGDYINGKCPDDDNQYSDCGNYYSPQGIHVGGAVGVMFNSAMISETSVREGAMNVRPVVDETITDHIGAFDHGKIAVAGLAGTNYQSTILSTCSSPTVAFSDDGYTIERVSDGNRPLYGYGMYFGGLVGISSTHVLIPACIYNSCSHSDLEIDAEISDMTGVGGISGSVIEDVLVNNFYDGEIITSEASYVGQIVGQLENYDEFSMVSNYYPDNGKEPVGTYYPGDYDVAFGTFSDLEVLAATLNNGRALVSADVADRHPDADNAYLNEYLTGWSIQDGTFTLSCIRGKSVGLEFPDERVVGVPNTGFDL